MTYLNNMPTHITDLTGKTFGRLTVISLHSVNPRPRWNCVCTCGGTSVSLSTHLKDGGATSCGCYARELHTTHGECGKTKEYRTWALMKYTIYDGRRKNIMDN